MTRVAKGPSDLDLIRDYLGGDVAAFDTLFKRYHKAIYGLTFRLLRDRQLAEDLTQETFFQILRTIHRINDSFNFSAWIHRIATNLCYDELRRRKKFPEAQEIDDEENEDSVLQVPDGDARKSPEVALEISELRDAVWSVARRLPEKYRLVLTLRELQGLSYANIARKMRVSESAVETLLHRARRRFKEEFLSWRARPRPKRRAARRSPICSITFPPGTLRREQRKMVAQHLDSCPGLLRTLPEPAAPAAQRRGRAARHRGCHPPADIQSAPSEDLLHRRPLRGGSASTRYLAAWPPALGLVFDCADPDKLANFWAAALHYKIQDPPPGFAAWPDFEGSGDPRE